MNFKKICLLVIFTVFFTMIHAQDSVEKKHKDVIIDIIDCLKRLDRPKLYQLIDTITIKNKGQLEFDIKYLNKKFQNIDSTSFRFFDIKATLNPANNLVNYQVRVPLKTPDIDFIDLNLYIIKNDLNGYVRIFTKKIHYITEEPLIQAPKSSNL